MDSLRTTTIEASRVDKFNYYGDFFLLPVILLGDIVYIAENSKFDFSVFLFFILGLLLYGAVLEYGFHRFLYHGSVKKIKKLHLIHHKMPQSYVSSPPYVTAVLIFIFHVVFISLFGYKLGCSFVAGIVLGYLWYICIHHGIHHFGCPNSKILNYFKVEHQAHHDHAKLNYCVSQPFWNDLYRKFKKS